MAALGKPVFAYMNVEAEDDAELRGRIENEMGLELDRRGVWRDGFGGEIEDFGLPEDLMLWGEARRLFVVVTPDVFGDLTGFEMCLDAVKLYSD
jgi:nucleoside 2-deoxyribosyltransferase